MARCEWIDGSTGAHCPNEVIERWAKEDSTIFWCEDHCLEGKEREKLHLDDPKANWNLKPAEYTKLKLAWRAEWTITRADA